jgi:hypothetical protein
MNTQGTKEYSNTSVSAQLLSSFHCSTISLSLEVAKVRVRQPGKNNLNSEGQNSTVTGLEADQPRTRTKGPLREIDLLRVLKRG